MFPSNWYDNSVCKNCQYGERITVGVFCNELQGLVPVGYVGCKAEHAFYEEAYKKENGMTLTELANELRKIFRFKYLTKDSIGDIYCWNGKPVYDETESYWHSGSRGGVAPVLETWPSSSTVKSLDLSEYANETGEIDYSKCIVEVDE